MIYPKIRNLTHLSNFVRTLFDTCENYWIAKRDETPEFLHSRIRQPIWNYVISKCRSFSAMDCNEQFSEIFREQVLGELNDLEKALFQTFYSYNENCQNCGNILNGNLSTFINYFSWGAAITADVVSNWHSILFSYYS